MKKRIALAIGLAGVMLAVVTACAATPAKADIPACTDSIANSGGVCQGPLQEEPEKDPSAEDPALLPPCATEDADGCYWDAETMGNGLGHDVVTPPVYDDYENDPPVEGEITGMDQGILVCGQYAKPAIDYDPEKGWWAYCEPALID